MPYNATYYSSGISGISSFSSMTGTIAGIFVLIAIVTLLILLVSSKKFVAFLMRIHKHLSKTFGLFLYGVGGLAFVGSTYGLFRLAQKHGQATINIFKWILIIIIGYYAIVGFGWLVKLFCKQVKKNWLLAKKRKLTKAKAQTIS